MRKPFRRWGLITAALAAAVLIAACGAGQSGGGSTPLVKPPAAAIADPFALLQAETDKYLKKGLPLYIEPREVLTKAVTGVDQSYYLVDVRSDEHYAAAHIPGAIHIAYQDAWREDKTAFLPRDRKIVVIDYSGHTASQVAAFWGMLGLDAVAMKNGMAGWSGDREVVGGSPLPCEPLNYPVTTAAAGPSATFEPPKLTTKATSPAELLASRSQEATAEAPVIQPKDFREKLAGYFVLDIRQPEHFRAGHIEGAVNIPFRSLAAMENLKKISPDKTVVVVCYDGHAASQAARLLNQLGYHATALKDGMSVWTGDEGVIGAKAIACNVGDNPVAKLNAPLKPGPSAAAT